MVFYIFVCLPGPQQARNCNVSNFVSGLLTCRSKLKRRRFIVGLALYIFQCAGYLFFISKHVWCFKFSACSFPFFTVAGVLLNVAYGIVCMVLRYYSKYGCAIGSSLNTEALSPESPRFKAQPQHTTLIA